MESTQSHSNQEKNRMPHAGVVAIVGRPNVGKSTLINRIIGARKAIVDDLPGVTRDRSYYDADWNGRGFTLIDTGGLVPESDDFFESLINQQVEIALLEADVIVFVVDGHTGLTPVDESIAQQIRQTKKSVVVAVNKTDKPEERLNASEFHSLGLGTPYPLSAMHGTGGVGDLLDVVVDKLPPLKTQDSETDSKAIRIALVGKPNVGKSSILNALVGKERSIVSDIPGTTRDAIDVLLHHEGTPFVLVDTAGIRKKGKVDYGIEMFSVDRSLRAVRQADVTVMVMDASQGVTDQDKKIIETSNEAGNGLILVFNKWDLIPDKKSNTTHQFEKEFMLQLPHAQFAPVVFTSATTGQRLTQIYKLASQVYENTHRRIKTNLVNQVLMDATSMTPPPSTKSRRLKIIYGTQVQAAPPTFVLFVNDSKLMKPSYLRYLEKKMRENFEFSGSPIEFILRNRGDKA